MTDHSTPDRRDEAADVGGLEARLRRILQAGAEARDEERRANLPSPPERVAAPRASDPAVETEAGPDRLEQETPIGDDEPAPAPAGSVSDNEAVSVDATRAGVEERPAAAAPVRVEAGPGDRAAAKGHPDDGTEDDSADEVDSETSAAPAGDAGQTDNTIGLADDAEAPTEAAEASTEIASGQTDDALDPTEAAGATTEGAAGRTDNLANPTDNAASQTGGVADNPDGGLDETTSASEAGDSTSASPVPPDFGLDDEHPTVAVPFTLHLNGRRLAGDRLSVTHIHARAEAADAPKVAERGAARLRFSFAGFDLTIQAEVSVLSVKPDGSATLCFVDPTGAHLPQLRYVLNNSISGHLVTMNGLLAYTGPTQPKGEKPPAPKPGLRDRARSLAVLAVSGLLIIGALAVLFSRYTTGREMYPVFLKRAGQEMRATTAGQLSYLNPAAEEGDVVFSINANTGDMLNFVMPCTCDFAIANDLSEGTTVLPSDLILTIFENTSEIRAHTMISVEGLARAMEGDNVYLDLNDGRSLPVDVIVSTATSDAALTGSLFVPVQLRTDSGALTAKDIGKSGRLRITANMSRRLGLQ